MDEKLKIKIVKDCIEEAWDDSEIISAWNDRCSEMNDPDSMIEDINMFDEAMQGTTPLDIARAITYGNFNPIDNYWGYNGYGNVVSFNSPKEFDSFDLDELSEFVASRADDYDFDSHFFKVVLLHTFLNSDEGDVLESLIENEGTELAIDDWDAIGIEINTALGKN